MKKILLLIVFTALSFSASAQYGEFYYGAKLGVNVANMAAADLGNPIVRLNVGITADYRISYRFGIGAELFFNGTGTSMRMLVNPNGVPIEDDVHLNMNYISLPVLAKVYLIKGLNVEAGAQVNFLVSTVINYRGDRENISSDGTNKVEFAVPLGLMYDFDSGLTLGARMQLGVTELYKNDKNNIFSLNVGYKF